MKITDFISAIMPQITFPADFGEIAWSKGSSIRGSEPTQAFIYYYHVPADCKDQAKLESNRLMLTITKVDGNSFTTKLSINALSDRNVSLETKTANFNDTALYVARFLNAINKQVKR